MPNPSYVNQITPQEVSLALEHLLIAPAGTTWTPGRVTVDAPPANFIHLGAVADDSPSISITKQKYEFSTGLPSILAYQAITGVAGQLGMVMHSFDSYAAYMASGGLPPYLVPKTTASVFGTVNTTPTTTRSFVNVNTTTAIFALNDMVVTDTTAALNTSRNYAWITALVTVGTSYELTLQGTGFPFTPVAAHPLVAISYSRFALGTNALPEFVLLGVADFLNGAQIVHYAGKARPTGEWSEALRNGAHVQVPVSFDLLGYSVTSPYSTAGQLVVAERYLWMPQTVQ